MGTHVNKKPKQKPRIYYIDNLRVFLIGLVVLLHFNITYGAPGDWYYNESESGIPEIIPQAMFNATNQAFFMGMFFFISAFFAAASLKRKPPSSFLKGRLVRLGIPLLVFYFILNPLTVYIKLNLIQGVGHSFWELLLNKRAWGVGPMWFVLTLLVFTVLYLLARKFKTKIRLGFPKTWAILLSALFVALLQFLIRVKLPVGWSMPITGWQFPFFVQYIFMLFFGVVAFENNWLESITFKMGKYWFLFAQVLVFIGFPVVFMFIGNAPEKGLDMFMGGLYWENLSYAIWEQLVGFSMIIGLFGLFKHYFNKQGKFAKALSGGAYSVYFFHPPIIVGLSAIFLSFQINQLAKFVILAPIALIACFGIALVFKKIPIIKKIL